MNEIVFRVGEIAQPMALAELPVTRCIQRGPNALSTVELLAVLLGRGVKGKTALELASEILSRIGSLRALSQVTGMELTKLTGLGLALSSRIQAALELSRRFAEEEVRMAETLGGAEEAYKFLRPRLRDLAHEIFGAIWLSQKNSVISYAELFRGSVHGSSVHPREVVKAALKENAAAVILCHNHPSGHVSPSPDDLRLTEELKGVLQHIDVRVIDHIIVGGNGYFSFAREGLLS
jgi:DNA repair protein RadC